MFGRVKHHWKKAVGIGNTIAHRVSSAYGHGQKVAAGLSSAYKFAKDAYAVASPFLGQIIGERGQAIADRGAQQACGLGDRDGRVLVYDLGTCSRTRLLRLPAAFAR